MLLKSISNELFKINTIGRAINITIKRVIKE